MANPLIGKPRAMYRISRYLSATAGKLNVPKCEGFLTGDARDHPPQAGFEWTNDGEYLISLGLPQGNEIDYDDYWIEIIAGIQKTLSKWRSIQHVTQIDRAVYFTALVQSRIVYPLQFLFISPKIIKTLEGLMHRMIWERDPRFSKLDTQADPDLDPLAQIGLSLIHI